jgi:hypothetical protein
MTFSVFLGFLANKHIGTSHSRRALGINQGSILKWGYAKMIFLLHSLGSTYSVSCTHLRKYLSSPSACIVLAFQLWLEQAHSALLDVLIRRSVDSYIGAAGGMRYLPKIAIFNIGGWRNPKVEDQPL